MSLIVSAIPPPPCSPRMLKRPRSSSNDRLSLEQILKACKRSDPASPHSPVGASIKLPSLLLLPQRPSQKIPADVTTDPRVASLSPLLQACSSMKSAIPFLQNSRRHALSLLLQNQCERALNVLEKIERANDMISRQRRRFVMEQANAIHKYNSEHQDDDEASEQVVRKVKRTVSFSNDVTVVDAETMDRSPAQMPPLIREEILVLRASRPIPVGNFSELWN